MSFRRTLFALLLAFALLAAPVSFAAELANPPGLWQAFTHWLMSSLDLGNELEEGRHQGDSTEGGDIFLPGGQPEANNQGGPGDQSEGSDLFLPGG